jgi:MFS family permease
MEGYPKYQLLWTAAPYDDEAVDGIVGKIQSKMTAAASLGTVITGLLVFLLTSGSETRSWWSWASLMLFVGAAALYFVTMFFYDSLSLAPRFWAPGQSAGHRTKHQWLLRPLRRIRRGRTRLLRPPSSTARVLAEAMMHTWSSLFLPATVLTGLGVAMLVADMAFGSTGEALIESKHVVGTLLYLLALGLYAAAHRPNLGASD